MHGQKTIFLVLFALLMNLALAGATVAAERCVLAEMFLSSIDWTSCENADQALDSVVEFDYGPDELAVIRNGTTHFYTHQGYNRFFWYPAIGGNYDVPAFWIDGVHDLDGAHSVSWWRTEIGNRILARRALSSPLELDFQVNYGKNKDQTGTVHVQVIATGPIAFTDLNLRVAVVESGLSYLGVDYDQLLRNYFPDHLGIPFAIAQGDTFNHSQEFVMHVAGRAGKAFWLAENCELVVFVQDDVTYEVLQAAHSPVLIPQPGAVGNLTIALDEEALRLDWSPVLADTAGLPLTVDHYNVYRDTVAHFDAGSTPLAMVADTVYVDESGPTGDPGKQYFYRVTAVAGYKESEPSAGVGEFDRETSAGG